MKFSENIISIQYVYNKYTYTYPIRIYVLYTPRILYMHTYTKRIQNVYLSKAVESLSKACRKLSKALETLLKWKFAKSHQNVRGRAIISVRTKAPIFRLLVHSLARRVTHRARMKSSVVRGQEICAHHAGLRTSVNFDPKK